MDPALDPAHPYWIAAVTMETIDGVREAGQGSWGMGAVSIVVWCYDNHY